LRFLELLTGRRYDEDDEEDEEEEDDDDWRRVDFDFLGFRLDFLYKYARPAAAVAAAATGSA
jgi:hypothetical protein